jgi:hypothetical protein
MHVGDAASWATIVGLPVAVIGVAVAVVVPMVIAVGGRQRGLRQHLREILDPLVKACDEYQCGVDDYLTEEFLRATAEKLRILSKRDGLKSPNANHIGQLLDILIDIANRFDVPRLLPSHGISQHQREQMLEANEQRLKIAIEQAKRRAATYIRAVNKMDGWHYLTYLRFKRFGITSRTFGEVASDFHPWTGPVT